MICISVDAGDNEVRRQFRSLKVGFPRKTDGPSIFGEGIAFGDSGGCG